VSPLGVLVSNILSEEVWDVSREVRFLTQNLGFFRKYHYLGLIWICCLRSSPLGVLVPNILSEEVGDESRLGFSSNPKFRVFLRKVCVSLFSLFFGV
jgi:hypothetical protein